MIVLRAFVLDDGQDVVSLWHEQCRNLPKVRARLDVIMLHLGQQPREGWKRDYFDTLRDGVGEVRFKVGGVNYRPLGSFVPGRNEFTFTLFATKTNRFDPRDAIDIAARRRIYIELHNSRSKVVKDRWGQ